jgi:hypothetical protein
MEPQPLPLPVPLKISHKVNRLPPPHAPTMTHCLATGAKVTRPINHGLKSPTL